MVFVVVAGTAGTCQASLLTSVTFLSLPLALPDLPGLLGPCPLLHLVQLHRPLLPPGQPGLDPVGSLVVLVLVSGVLLASAPVVRMVLAVDLAIAEVGF